MKSQVVLILCTLITTGWSQSATAAFTVNVIFDDVTSNTGVGFDDPVAGLARRQTVMAVMNYVSSQFDSSVYNATVDYQILASETDGSGALAGSSPFYFTSPNGYRNGFVYDHATTGVDPYDPVGGFPDAQARFDFGYGWYAGTNRNPGGLFDLYTVTLHELTHSLGFLSAINGAGLSSISGGNPGVFGVFATFLERGEGTGRNSSDRGANISERLRTSSAMICSSMVRMPMLRMVETRLKSMLQVRSKRVLQSLTSTPRSTPR